MKKYPLGKQTVTVDEAVAAGIEINPRKVDEIIKEKFASGAWVPDYVNGKIYSTTTDDYLKPKKNNCGYEYINTRDQRTRTIHRAYISRSIWIARNGIPADSSVEVDHINCNKLDNSLANLRLLTHQENRRYQPSKFARAEAIRREHEAGVSTKELALKYDYSRRAINYILRCEMYDPAKYPGDIRPSYPHIVGCDENGKEILRWNK